jgi:hypothetical protein
MFRNLLNGHPFIFTELPQQCAELSTADGRTTISHFGRLLSHQPRQLGLAVGKTLINCHWHQSGQVVLGLA